MKSDSSKMCLIGVCLGLVFQHMQTIVIMNPSSEADARQAEMPVKATGVFGVLNVLLWG